MDIPAGHTSHLQPMDLATASGTLSIPKLAKKRQKREQKERLRFGGNVFNVNVNFHRKKGHKA